MDPTSGRRRTRFPSYRPRFPEENIENLVLLGTMTSRDSATEGPRIKVKVKRPRSPDGGNEDFEDASGLQSFGFCIQSTSTKVEVVSGRQYLGEGPVEGEAAADDASAAPVQPPRTCPSTNGVNDMDVASTPRLNIAQVSLPGATGSSPTTGNFTISFCTIRLLPSSNVIHLFLSSSASYCPRSRRFYLWLSSITSPCPRSRWLQL